MNNIMKYAGFLLFIVMVGVLVGSCARWQWNECRKVGHSVAYCVYDLGRK